MSPPVPEKYSLEFLSSNHPLREGNIASHVILGFDYKSRNWVCVEKDIVPGSLGADGMGLPGVEQDEIIAGIEVRGVKLASPENYLPCKRVIDTAIALHLSEGRPIDSVPLRGIYARTADTKHAQLPNAVVPCRVNFGNSVESGTHVDEPCTGALAHCSIGLLGAWE